MKVVSNNILAIYWEQFHFPRNSTTLFEIDLPADLLLFAGKAGAPRSLNELPLETEVRSLFFYIYLPDHHNFSITVKGRGTWTYPPFLHNLSILFYSCYATSVCLSIWQVNFGLSPPAPKKKTTKKKPIYYGAEKTNNVANCAVCRSFRSYCVNIPYCIMWNKYTRANFFGSPMKAFVVRLVGWPCIRITIII